jgi:hypothetical protein
MIKINISDKSLKKMAELEEGAEDLTAMNPNHPNYNKPEEEINYSWDLSTEEKKD